MSDFQLRVILPSLSADRDYIFVSDFAATHAWKSRICSEEAYIPYQFVHEIKERCCEMWEVLHSDPKGSC